MTVFKGMRTGAGSFDINALGKSADGTPLDNILERHLDGYVNFFQQIRNAGL
jgi:hypothetical protein